MPNASDMDFRGAIQLLTQIVATHAQWQKTSVVDVTGSSRSREFLNMKPPIFTGSKKAEDLLKEEERLQRERDMDYSKRAKSVGNFSHGESQGCSNRQFFRKPKLGSAPSSAGAPVQGSKFNKKNQNFIATDSQSQANVGYRVPGYPIFNTCCKRHLGLCRSGTNGCFG
ncbi:uncharacterized protein [Nicotiana tomentosiformis]|uniref:uncharacterized protein n=1 Tax=Nicotiana tomentosiformis TaxID=4098 RepID=UPI00388C8BBE